MNRVTLNGIKSSTVKGLLIQSLPPISKPLIRTQIEEIDGRDGDIVTKLGYSAYDKEMSIGLRGDYDVDEVIQFFDSEGKVIFSNEPDKYYNYQIIEQIDFERLVRYKTAKVVFHVQPFKYSAVDKAVTMTNQLLSFNNFSQTKNGITLTAEKGTILISGTGTSATEIYVPVNALSLPAGNYKLNAYASGDNPDACSIRLIKDSPSNANSFGNKYVTLQNESVVSIESDTLSSTSFNYLYFYIVAGRSMDFSLDLRLENENVSSLSATNMGNTIAKPKVTIYGSGTINLSLNGEQLFVINLGGEGYITLDSAQMEAYKEGKLMNRFVSGDIGKLVFKQGKNTISWIGDVAEVSVDKYSRWI